ncbi:MAG: hypothetical protein KGZ49_11675 [Syntrophaceae bacterium]|nr:hypothetical protein [Syntrophaceae bacterium]
MRKSEDILDEGEVIKRDRGKSGGRKSREKIDDFKKILIIEFWYHFSVLKNLFEKTVCQVKY